MYNTGDYFNNLIALKKQLNVIDVFDLKRLVDKSENVAK
jgi:hypothetical protein